MLKEKMSAARLGKLSLNAKILTSLIAALVVGLAATAYFISDKSARTTQDLSEQSGRELACPTLIAARNEQVTLLHRQRPDDACSEIPVPAENQNSIGRLPGHGYNARLS